MNCKALDIHFHRIIIDSSNELYTSVGSFFNLYFTHECMIICVFMFACIRVQLLVRAEARSIGSHRAGVRCGCELTSNGCWKMNSGPLQWQVIQALTSWATSPALSHFLTVLFNICGNFEKDIVSALSFSFPSGYYCVYLLYTLECFCQTYNLLGISEWDIRYESEFDIMLTMTNWSI